MKLLAGCVYFALAIAMVYAPAKRPLSPGVQNPECNNRNGGKCACPTIVSRASWGARAPTSTTHLTNQPVQYAFIHHGASANCHDRASCVAMVKSYQNYHMDTHGWADIGYSFVIGGDGAIYEGRGWDRVGAHTLNYNSVGLGFCLTGTFTSALPPTAQTNAVKSLIACGVTLGKLRSAYTLRGHRDMDSTECPGTKLYNEIKTWAHY